MNNEDIYHDFAEIEYQFLMNQIYGDVLQD